ncbi:hypothetical protein CKO35_05675 [Ectothiorhodospira shaposhnikovii]|uniref:DUF2058 family protein n=1 Tax=Ectothiorhodospira shaposhnikovii TaxID=1054 RepID=UPI0019075585|nr:DUF2058 family protein [Ectothiorhodospira shaposhnikovii]MBK1672797.1 hypothetical protein [Ectothiorhodospira shaposhnikovii]
MTQSLREQLLQAGLVTEEQVRKVEQARAPEARQGKRSGPQNGKPAKAGEKVKARPRRKARKNPERGSARSHNQLPSSVVTKAPLSPAADARALKQQLRELVTAHRVNKEEADVPYHFQVGTTIKHLYVTSEQQEALADGRLCIAFLDGRRNLLPSEQGREILRIDPSRTVIFPGD